MSLDLAFQSATELASRLRRRELSAVELLRRFLRSPSTASSPWTDRSAALTTLITLYDTNATQKANNAAFGIAQRVDLAVEAGRQLAEGGLHRPAAAVQVGDRQGVGDLGGEVRQDVDLGLAVAGRRVQLDGDPPHHHRPAVAVAEPHLLLEHRPGLGPPAGPPLAHRTR